ncbi:MAG: UDP-N-acetylglucosamine 1-carboxyvinyltransferase [Eubacteriaceae bacterium]|nr:UDP-N-acetylglucosamine 1-carboxyvinyltransferase [Eubacteriaceae bacterium]
MEQILINGGKRLSGEVSISAAKNACLGILPATVLLRGKCVIENLPDILDIKNYIQILRKLGAEITIEGSNTIIDTSSITYDKITEIQAECSEMRASYYMLGALLSRFNKVKLPFPGGCDIGARPIDLHIKGFEALGAAVEVSLEGAGYVDITAGKLAGASIYLDIVSVGATINIMLAAVMVSGVTTIENAAKEPHVVDIANFLNLAGANIKGAGTGTIKITGVKRLHPVSYSPIPDQIEAGTYMLAAVATCGDILVKNVIPEHLDSICSKIVEMGSGVEIFDEAVRVIGKRPISNISLNTMPYPGFPTDLQQPMGALLCIAEGKSTIQENIFENRFAYLDELRKMGADVTVDGNVAEFSKIPQLQAAKIKATDLRAGAAMVVAALMAEGESEISEIQHIDRGYDNIIGKMSSLGAQIRRIGP